MKPKPILLASVIVAVVAIGCGGSGITTNGGTNTGSGSTAGGTTTGSTPPSAVRQNVNGDRFIYVVSGTYTAAGATTSTPTVGSGAEAFQTEAYSDASALADGLGIDLQVGTASFSYADTKLLTANGLTLAQSDDGSATAGTPTPVISGALTLPTSLSMAYTVNQTEGLLGGTTVQITENVTGFQSVTVGAGVFNCWTISKVATWSDGLTQTETIQFSPVLGAAVQRTETDTKINGYSFTVTESLASYTFGMTPG